MNIVIGAVLRLGLVALLATPTFAEGIFFSRTFPQSVPPYFEVDVSTDGKVIYREEPGEEDPLTFQLESAEVERIYSLIRSIGPAAGVAVKRKKVAFTGDKVLRVESADGAPWEAKFQHTESEAANEVVRWFNLISESERHRIELERVIIFDRLGVNKALLQFHSSYDKQRVIGAKQFLPVLNKIAEGKAFLHMARARAASLVEQIEAGANSGESSQ